MKIQNYMPRQSCIIFLRCFTICSSLIAVIFIGAVIAFVMLLPNDEYGWRGMRSAFWSFMPGVLIFGYAALSSAQELRSIKKLPDIEKQADVGLLVSKWDEKTLKEHKSAERVEVTMRLIEAFKPNEKQKKSAIEIQKHAPVPVDKMKDHKH